MDSLSRGFSPNPEEEQQCVKKHLSTEKALGKSAPSAKTNDIINNVNSTHSKKIHRGGVRHKLKHVKPKAVGHIKIFSTNGAGIKNSKVTSLNAEVRSTQANIITVQETHCRQKGKIYMGSDFVTFEAIRNKKGGGTMIAVHHDLNPKLIEEYDDEFELLVVEIKTVEESIRVISGYGPQENWEEERRLPFFIALETEIEKATLAGKTVIIEMDANSKLGPNYIPEDPHDMTPNGALLAGIIDRHNLIVGNGSNKCKGVITRKRVTKERTETSVIDILLFSSDLNKHFVSLNIDEEKKHVLTKCINTRKGIKVKESDHNVLISEFNCNVKDDKGSDRLEIYNLKNRECQLKFKKYTDETTMLSSSVDEEGDINQVKKD